MADADMNKLEPILPKNVNQPKFMLEQKIASTYMIA